MESVFARRVDEYQVLDVLKPRGLTREFYEKLLLSGVDNSIVRDLYTDMQEWAFDCDLMFSGYDLGGTPFVISAGPPGKAFSHLLEGSFAIGVASKTARTRMLWAGYDTKHTLGRVLFDCFDAKATAELHPSVGTKWDALVLQRGGSLYSVPKSITRDLIEAGWDNHVRSPFEEWNEEEDLPPPGDGLEKRVLNMTVAEFEKLRD
jgi:hypothetical protein